MLGSIAGYFDPDDEDEVEMLSGREPIIEAVKEEVEKVVEVEEEPEEIIVGKSTNIWNKTLERYAEIVSEDV